MRSKTIDGNIQAVVGTGQLYFYPSGGPTVGTVFSAGSVASSILNLSGLVQSSYDAVIADGVTAGDIQYHLGNLNTAKNSLEDFQEDIEFFDKYASWLWGNVEHGGTFVIYYNDPNNPRNVYCGACNGVYYQFNNEQEWYKYNIGGSMEPFRTTTELQECFLAYAGDTNSINLVCHKPGTGIVVNGLKEIPGAPPTFYYESIGTTASFQGIAATKNFVTNPLTNEKMHACAYVLNNANSHGGFNDLGIIFDDENFNIDGWEHLSGHWFGGDSIQPNPDETNEGDEEWTEPDYEPSEADRKQTEDDQFDIDAINSGLVTIFNPKQDEVMEFGEFLFSGITEDIATFFKRLMSSPLDYIITMNLVHYKPETNGAAEIKFGGIGSGVSSLMVKKQFQKISFGKVKIARQFGTYMDFGGFTRIKVYLPYCGGKHDLDVDLSMGAEIELNYYIDNLSGACVAQLVYTRGHMHEDDRAIEGQCYEFTGNVFEELPLSASDYRSVISGALTAAAGVGSFVAGNPVSGAAAIASGVMSMKPNIQHSGKAGSNFGYMGSQYPYVEVYRPNPANPPRFYQFGGYPSHKTIKVKDMSGFIQAEKDGIKLSGVKYATDEELKEIKDLFEQGVYLYV